MITWAIQAFLGPVAGKGSTASLIEILGVGLLETREAVRHLARLHARLPIAGRRLDFLLLSSDELGRNDHDDVVNGADTNSGVASHGGVDGIPCKPRAEDVIVG